MRKPILAIAAALVPSTALATETVIGLSHKIQQSVYKPVVYLLLSFALLLFLWGVYRYMARSGSEADVKEGAQLMSYGILTLFVMVAVWGLVRMVLHFFGFEEEGLGTPSSSVFGVSVRSYDSGQSYGAADYDSSYRYEYR